ncbi:putative nadh:ubiquinone oxidoreductase subunit [Diplodia seriata]|uniref:Putative nadh:ubiquinone oxidoreductase subunit n=1 Tax=Diplodia seriata TaxID=420778 RepID=A0A0G2GFM6_9PEZI|nr:putative nadh:ubiquinone oxidoreductase subunit [Diplodia seriata]
MAGDHHVLHEDPALVKYGIYIDDHTDVGPNRYKYFRWTPRTAWISFWVAIAVPSVVGLVAYNTDGKYDLRGKRRGDVIKEF